MNTKTSKRFANCVILAFCLHILPAFAGAAEQDLFAAIDLGDTPKMLEALDRSHYGDFLDTYLGISRKVVNGRQVQRASHGLGDTPLTALVKRDDLEMLKAYLNKVEPKKININYRAERKSEIDTALSVAKSVEVASFLIEKGADKNAILDHGLSTLMRTIMNRNFDVTLFLLSTSVNVYVKAASQGEYPRHNADETAESLAKKLLAEHPRHNTEELGKCEKLENIIKAIEEIKTATSAEIKRVLIDDGVPVVLIDLIKSYVHGP